MLSVQSELEQAIAKLRSITEAKQLRYATARALTHTAVDVQKEVKTNLPKRFTLRRDWVVQGIRIQPATKESLTAVVYSRDRFMGLQETGGAKNPLRNYIAIPTNAVRRTPRDLIKKADRPAALGNKAEVVEVRGNKYLALKRARKGRSNNKLRLLYLLVPRAQLQPRLKLNEDGQRVARAKFMAHLDRVMAEAVRTAR